MLNLLIVFVAFLGSASVAIRTPEKEIKIEIISDDQEYQPESIQDTSISDLAQIIQQQRKYMESLNTKIDSLTNTVSRQQSKIVLLENQFTEAERCIHDLEKAGKVLKERVLRQNSMLEKISTAFYNNYYYKHRSGSVLGKNQTNETGMKSDSSDIQTQKVVAKKPLNYSGGHEKQLKQMQSNQKVYTPHTSTSNAFVSTKYQRRSIAIDSGIAFSAVLKHNLVNMGPGHTIKMDEILLNDGNAFNIHTGIFTVPASGVYLLTFTTNVYFSGRHSATNLVVDNRVIVSAIIMGSSTSHYVMGGNTAIIRLTGGQTVWLESYYYSDNELDSSSKDRLVTFSGVLLYT